MDPTEKDLLLQHISVVQQQGDESYASFKIIWQVCLPSVKSIISKIGLEGADMEDAVQETCIALWKKFSSFNPDISLITTLAQRIARNRAIDLIRGNKRREKRDSAYFGEILIQQKSVHPSSHDKYDRYDLLNSLIKKHWNATTVSIVQSVALGESFSEIASKLNLPIPTVKSRWRRFQQLFNKHYGRLFNS